jgi:hypothetical protein
VELRAAFDAGEQFVGWEGDCAGAAATPITTISMTADRTCRAVFTSLGGFTLTLGDDLLTTAVGGAPRNTAVTITRTGYQGDVQLLVLGCPATVNCLLDPTTIGSGETAGDFILVPSPGIGGDHSITVQGVGGGTQRSDSVVLRLVGATFTLSLGVTGTGLAIVEYTPAVAVCVKNAAPVNCNRAFNAGSTVTLRAVLSPGSVFGGWTGCDSVAGVQCTVNMTSNRSIQAVINGF